MEAQQVTHTLEPVFDGRSSVLVLGTMPSPASRAQGFYYGHPQNRFWRVLAALFGEVAPTTISKKRHLVLSHGIALWDVLASCTIEGASDASIADAVPNDLGPLLAAAPIGTVVTTGAAAARFYRQFDKPRWPELSHVALPSTSAANASMRLDDLIKAYKPLKELAHQ